MTYAAALEYLDSFINYEKDRSFEYPEAFKLDRMRALAREFGNPQKSFESILIAGSKGKGSTAAILSSVLRMENYRVGLFTSPHLIDLRERFQVNGLHISETRFAEYVRVLSKLLDDYAWKKNPPTYFELLTVIALQHFKEMKVHVAVLEVGLGGLYDSTNIVEAKVAGITRISLEHTDKLGKTIAKIAVQKAGIIKGREIVISAAQPADAERTIQKACEERDARLFRLGKEIKFIERFHDDKSQRFDVKSELGNYFDLELRLLGTHQLENAAQAIALAKALESKTRLKVSEEAVRRGILDAHWPGRMELIGNHPRVILDGAHNPESVERLLAAVKRHFIYERLSVVFAAAKDKDWEGMLERLLPETQSLTVTRIPGERAEDTHAIADTAGKNFSGEISVEEEVGTALEDAMVKAGAHDIVLVTGSLYLVGEIKRALAEGRLHVA